MRGGTMSGGGASLVEAEVGGLAWCLGVWEGVWEWLGWLCEAQRGDGTCAAWKTVLGSGEGLGRALGFGALGRVGQ